MRQPLIHADGHVLAAIDPSVYGRSVAGLAAWAAGRLEAPLVLLHTIQRNLSPPAADLSGNLSLGGQEALMAQLADLDEQRARLAQEHGRILLEQTRDQLAGSGGVEAEVRQRHGELSDTLLDLEAGVRLFVLGKRGEHADFDRGQLGGQLEHVLRAVHRPVLVASRAFRPPQHFMIAFDGGATTRRCVEMVCASPLLKGLACELMMVGDAENAALREHLAWAKGQLEAAGFAPNAGIFPGHPEAVIAREVGARGIDLLVMGAYGHSRIRTLILGSTTTQVLRSCPIPVLLLR
ncbi:MAG TPA: universal stress protein [Arenimonas sp.]|uniref:universal stress protein n=1 Tax=Arenimonas sp. TaxID=1872635 RepID=UPI002D7F4391|nr:universal stress protein [Arenimonas sp.]HEU0153840.1 universal stress protein [Arenimonas sp.]